MKILIIGGAGFIGVNAASYFLSQKAEKHEVVIFDNLSRQGTSDNLEWLQSQFQCKFVKGDIRNYEALESFLLNNKDADAVIQLAAQVAVTTSVLNPRMDFDINLTGTFNILEALRVNELKPLLIFASTNKVYGDLEELEVKPDETRYVLPALPQGISEKQPLDFHSPYGCSKGAAEQYVRDYSRIYGIPTVVFRQSCIYGCHQFGVEDQGWVAWFTIASILGKDIKIYGDGKQVRDVLFVSDLVKAYDLAIQNPEKCSGQIYNVGGGMDNSISLLEFVEELGLIMGRKIDFEFSDWRPGDQKIFISDNRKFQKDFGWFPQMSYRSGFEKIYEWTKENLSLIEGFFS